MAHPLMTRLNPRGDSLNPQSLRGRHGALRDRYSLFFRVDGAAAWMARRGPSARCTAPLACRSGRCLLDQVGSRWLDSLSTRSAGIDGARVPRRGDPLGTERSGSREPRSSPSMFGTSSRSCAAFFRPRAVSFQHRAAFVQQRAAFFQPTAGPRFSGGRAFTGGPPPGSMVFRGMDA